MKTPNIGVHLDITADRVTGYELSPRDVILTWARWFFHRRNMPNLQIDEVRIVEEQWEQEAA